MTRRERGLTRAWRIILLLGLAAPSCGGDASSYPATDTGGPALCQARPDSVTTGCFATPSAMDCTAPACQSLCAARLTPVTCIGAGPAGAIPVPEARAGCAIVPIPTPSDELFYCCPCPGP